MEFLRMSLIVYIVRITLIIYKFQELERVYNYTIYSSIDKRLCLELNILLHSITNEMV